MNTHDPAPLTPEERALAQHLARLGPHGEPSSALDAAVLAAAHAAAPPARATRRRWPVALGIAASLALAVGIAWQLRPLPEATVYDEAESAAAGAAAPPEAVAEQAAADAAATSARDIAAAPPSREERAAAPRPESGNVAKPVAPPVTRPTVAAQRVQASPPEPAQASDAAATGMAAPAPAPPPPPTTPPPGSSATIGTSAGTRAAPPATTREAAGNAPEDAFVEDVPPATADSPEVREAWLQRIRELARAGDTDAARASLEEFMHRHPDHPVPDDLRALIE